MHKVPHVDINEFDYVLPKERIAQFPLENRDDSRLLIYHDQQISHDFFKNIAHHLPQNSLMVYNETRVVQARLLFKKSSGAAIEIFCLEPMEPTREIQQAFEQTSGIVWKCLVGNSKKWKDEKLKLVFKRHGFVYNLFAERKQKVEDYSLIKFTWEPPTLSFSEILQQNGETPLPPYMNRPVSESDKNRYQTIYAQNEGSVAAPTAGLHFTPDVFKSLEAKGIKRQKVTLHVGAGTFKPVTSPNINEHQMHSEQIVIGLDTIIDLAENKEKLIAVGTTTVRTLESLYWHGVKSIINSKFDPEIKIHQWDPYEEKYNIGITANEALSAVLAQMKQNKMQSITGETQLMILPGYIPKLPDILITNFHMPKSTLLLLISTFTADNWRRIYDCALENNYRFLSYGDSCLFYYHK
ncbi:MAG: S-adenosylmethionine:tRNA ribosyltransferase-isomerase [Bacteroidales bacterium]|nr:S-adenosylmethionine:tRNA ribosyltransferase-isomerase [Bacteroidales bacterium]MCF8402656.1 S-adenosylmethionine:tRNA ribosyltransferase-isomerase [Bacteroidales bacterium]